MLFTDEEKKLNVFIKFIEFTDKTRNRLNNAKAVRAMRTAELFSYLFVVVFTGTQFNVSATFCVYGISNLPFT